MAGCVNRLFTEGTRCVETVDHEERHEHADEEYGEVIPVGKALGVRRVEQDRRRLVVRE